MTEDDPQQDHVARLREPERRITKHPGYQEYLLCLAFERSLTAVFIPNWKELLALLDQVATDPSLALEMVQNVRPPDVREKFQSDTTQRWVLSAGRLRGASSCPIRHRRRTPTR
jgi:hypothetical protein